MKKILSFCPSAKITNAVLFASLLIVSCQKQVVSPKQTDMSISTSENSNAFNSKLKICPNGTCKDVVVTTTTDSTKTNTPK